MVIINPELLTPLTKSMKSKYQKIKSICLQIYIHLIKYHYSSTQHKQHHLGDIISWLEQIQDIVRKNNIKSTRLLEELTYSKDYFIKQSKKTLEKKYGIEPTDTILDKCFGKLTEIIFMSVDKIKQQPGMLEC